MLQQLKSLTRDSAVYGIGHIAARMVTFLLLPFYSYHLTPAEYGEVTLYFLFIAVTQTFFIYGLDIAYLRYYTLAKEETERRRVTGTAFLASTATTVALTAVILMAAPGLGSLLIHKPVHADIVPAMIRLCAFILLFDTLSTFPFLQLRGNLRPFHFAGIKLINVFINLGLNIWLVGFLGESISGILWANLVASGATMLLLLPVVLPSMAVRMDRALLKEMIRFGIPNVPTYLFVMVIELADRKILELYRGLEEAGLYSAGYKLGMFMAVVTGAFRFAWQPFFLSHSSDENAPRLFARVLTYYLLATSYLFLFLSLFIAPIMETRWPGIGYLIDPRYRPGLSIFPIILLAHIFDGVYANLMVGVYLKKLTAKLPLVTGVAAAFTVAANLLLIPSYGMMAAAWITLVAFAVEAALLWVVVRTAYPVPYEWTRIARLTVGCGLVFVLGLLPIFGNALGKTLLLVAFPVLLLIIGFFDVSERQHIRRIFVRG